MFDPIKLMNMLKKVNNFKNNIESQLKKVKSVSSSGEGMIEIHMNGLFEVEKINIDPDIFYQKDVKFLEDLMQSCINSSTQKVKTTLIDKIKNMANNIDFFQ